MSRFSQFARNLFADETLYPRANVSRPLSDFRENYRGTTASKQDVDQYDVKFDWNASANDKLYVRYSRQTADPGRRRRSCRCRSRRRPTTRSGAWPRTGTASSATRSSTTCWSATAMDPSLSNPLDLLGLGELNNQLGIAGDQVMRGLTNIRWGNDLTEIGSAETGTNNVNQNFQINERLTWLRGRHTLKFGGSWNYYAQPVALSRQQWPQRVHRLQRVQFHGRAVCRLPARSGVAEGPRLGDGGVDAPAASRRPLRRGRFQDHRQPDVEPGPPLGLHVAVRREGRPPGQLRSDERGPAPRGPERQQPRALRRVLQRLGAARRLCLPARRALGVPRRLRHHAVHGRHRRQPAAAAQSAVLLRVGRPLRRDQRRRQRLRPASRGCRRSIGRRARCAPGIRICGRSSRSSGTSSPSICWDRGRRSTSATSATGRPSW